MTQLIFWIIIGIMSVEFLLEQFLEYLNNKSRNRGIPELLSGIYNDVDYKKSQEYGLKTSRLGSISASLTFVLTLIILFHGYFGLLDEAIRHFSNNEIIVGLLFFGIIGLLADIIGLPFQLYSTFVLEETYGFNRTTPKTFILDKIKGWLLGIVIGAPLYALIVFIYEQTGSYFWVLIWLVISVFSIFMSLFYSSLIVPLFNKQKPLEEGELRTAIESFSQKAGFKLHNIFVIDGSKRSSKANAYFTGFGPKKRIVLYDTLINDLSIDEVVAVLAHETGHYKHKHIVWGMLSGLLQTALLLFIFSLFIKKDSQLASDICNAIAGKEIAVQSSFHLGILAFGILYTPVNLILGLLGNLQSRKYEYQADAFAAKYGYRNELISGLKKLSKSGLSNLSPHPIYAFFHFSHPGLLQRVEALMK